MKTAKSLLESWSKKLIDYPAPNAYGPEGFNLLIDTLIKDVARNVARDNIQEESSKDDEEFLKFLKHRYAGLFAGKGQVQVINSMYGEIFARQADLCDKRHQEDWATSWDHAKTLLFRMLTTMMIAAVILSTGYLAQLWGIPLPMLRGL